VRKLHELHMMQQDLQLLTAIHGILPNLFIVDPAKASVAFRCVCGHRHEHPVRKWAQCVTCTELRGCREVRVAGERLRCLVPLSLCP
jgi:hypothetical protein